MLEKVRRYAEKYQMLTKEDCVIAGVSGGADSVSLLLLLQKMQEEMGFTLVAVHVNHGLRGKEADADEAYVKQLCNIRRIPFESRLVDVGAVAQRRKLSVEEAGREVRREIFQEVCNRYKGTKIALAHHQNDNVETFLFRLARGTGLKGLGGMAPVNGRYIRPLLCVSRKEIENYLEEEGVAYCTDRTNHSDIYARNLIRNQVIPTMEQGINLKMVEHMNRTMEQLRQIQIYMEEQTRLYSDQCIRQTDKGILILEKPFAQVPEIFRPLVMKEALVSVCQKEKDLEEVHLRQMEELMDKQTGRRLVLPYDMEAGRVYEGVELRTGKCVETEPEEFLLDLSRPNTVFFWGDKKICCRILNKTKIDGETLQKSNTKRFDCDIIKHGIRFRTRRPGDYVTIHPDGRTQKLKTYFINEKIPQEERDKILLVADGSHILWIVGYRVNCVYQIKEHTNCVLEVCIDEGEENGRDN